MFRNAEELVQKVNYYVNNDEERISITEAIYERVKKDFDYAFLYKNLFDDLMNKFSSQNRNMHIKMSQADVQKKLLEIDDITYFCSKTTLIDQEVLTHISITKQLNKVGGKIDFIYFGRVEKGSRIIPIYPFLNSDSIVFMSKNISNLNFLFMYIKYCLIGRGFYINQLCIVSNEASICGRINQFFEHTRVKKLARGMQFIIKYLGVIKRNLLTILTNK